MLTDNTIEKSFFTSKGLRFNTITTLTFCINFKKDRRIIKTTILLRSA